MAEWDRLTVVYYLHCSVNKQKSLEVQENISFLQCARKTTNSLLLTWMFENVILGVLTKLDEMLANLSCDGEVASRFYRSDVGGARHVDAWMGILTLRRTLVLVIPHHQQLSQARNFGNFCDDSEKTVDSIVGQHHCCEPGRSWWNKWQEEGTVHTGPLLHKTEGKDTYKQHNFTLF